MNSPARRRRHPLRSLWTGGSGPRHDDVLDVPTIFNPASQLLLDLFGETSGAHARIAIGVSRLPWNIPVEIEAELEI